MLATSYYSQNYSRIMPSNGATYLKNRPVVKNFQHWNPLIIIILYYVSFSFTFKCQSVIQCAYDQQQHHW